MTDKSILHMLSPLKHVSPFDANMALDAGYDAVVPYPGVALNDVATLVQDAIFSRPPKLGRRTGLFIGGKDAFLALDMLEAARKAMVPPFAASLFADPAGSFTTAAAMVVCVENALRERHGKGLDGLKVAVFGATGVVGFSSAVIAAGQKARPVLVGYDGPDRVKAAATEAKKRFDVELGFADGSSPDKIAAIVADAQVVFCAGRAGVRIVERAQLETATHLLIAADVNAVPPSGVEGVEATSKGEDIAGTRIAGIGALTIGQLKSRTESGLFKRMIGAEKPVVFDFRDAFGLARELA